MILLALASFVGLPVEFYGQANGIMMKKNSVAAYGKPSYQVDNCESVSFAQGEKQTDKKDDNKKALSRDKLRFEIPKLGKKNERKEVDRFFVETSSIMTLNGPFSITRNILQDKKGNIWLATWQGIIKYDGKFFTNVTNMEGLRRFRAFCIQEDRKGHVWLGTVGAGVYRYDGKTFKNLTTKDGLASDRVGCIYEDKAGNIWFGTEGGLSRFDGKSFRNFTTKNGLTNNDVNSIVEDDSGKFWIGNRGDACTFDGKTFSKIKRLGGASFDNVRSIIKDRNGNIWIGGNVGLWRYDGRSFDQIAKNFVGYIYEDKAGNLWTSSNAWARGIEPLPSKWLLTRYAEKSLQDKKPIAEKILTESGMLFGITEDKKGGIWFGSGRGAARYDGKSFNHFRKVEKQSGK